MVKKLILILSIFLFSFAIAKEKVEPIKANVSYDEDSARYEAFLDVQKKIEKNFYREYLKDPNRKENLENIEKKTYVLDSRILCPFFLSDNIAAYAVSYNDRPQNTFYYNYLGSLIKFDIISKQSYPRKVYGYTRFGNLVSVTFDVSETEQFVYDKKGKLKAHWVETEVLKKDDSIPRVFKLRRGE